MRNEPDGQMLAGDPLWYQDAIIYELHVRSFFDSNADGFGDFPGLIQKLDYLKDLGVTALWLLPFYPSPLRDDGYDIADYTDVNRIYGKLSDVRLLVKEAHRRGLRVITELVCNHTSDQHPWFQRARAARPKSAARDFYVWSETNKKYEDARVIFKDFEVSNWTWDHTAGAYYWHRFYSHQPDLNFDNPRVRQEIQRVMEFWLSMGIDGLRLDAIPYLYEREGTNCENLPETHQFLKDLRRHLDSQFRNRMLLAEANQWPEDAVTYFGNGDECQMAFHFPLMPRLFMSIRMEDRFPIVDILAQTPPIPESAQWALFLRNHDELTLEMVTDEERDYMYRAYTQDPEARINLGIRRRLAPLLSNNRRRIELMNGLLFSLPGTPVVYYGDEIGMGDNVFLGDRNGVRTPMQWSPDRNAGFSEANRQRLFLPVITDPEYHYETVNVETQQANQHSLLWWMKRLILLRKRYRAFGRGSLEFLHPENRKVLAFIRRYQDEQILCVVNLSRFVQAAELDLSAWRGSVPVEMFGETAFPPIGELPYFVTLGPHAFYWFSLQPQKAAVATTPSAPSERHLPLIEVPGGWERLFSREEVAALLPVLPDYIRERRWFGGKARRIKGVAVIETIPVRGQTLAYLTFIEVSYAEGDPETYLVPLACSSAEDADRIRQRVPHAAVAWVDEGEPSPRLLYDALSDAGFCQALLEWIAGRRRVSGLRGTLLASNTRAFRQMVGPEGANLEPSVLQVEQSNNSVTFGERVILKAFRRLGEGLNPELEVGRFLTEKTTFAHVAPLAGSLEYRPERGEPITLAVLQGYVPNQGDAWQYTLGQLAEFFRRVEALQATGIPDLGTGVPGLPPRDLPPAAAEALGSYFESATLLGRRTGEMHQALSSVPSDPAFAPERISVLDQQSIYQSMRSLSGRILHLLRSQMPKLPADAREEGRRVLEREDQINIQLRGYLKYRSSASRIRVHGDYHLGQVLYTGADFIIIDFEGEPGRRLGERRAKRPALRDVASMMRSFHYAGRMALRQQPGPPELSLALEPWVRFWVAAVSTAFLHAYLETARAASFIPQSPEGLDIELRTFLLEKALYELGYELNNRPDWVLTPLQGILDLVPAPAPREAPVSG